MTAELRFVVKGDPVAMPRARVTTIGGRPVRRLVLDEANGARVVVQARYAPKVFLAARAKSYRQTIALLARHEARRRGLALPLLGPVGVSCRFFFRPPVRGPALPLPAHRPDLDNLAKMVWDALQEAGILRDDGQVCLSIESKAWGDTPRTEIDVFVMHGTDAGELAEEMRGPLRDDRDGREALGRSADFEPAGAGGVLGSAAEPQPFRERHSVRGTAGPRAGAGSRR
jgi:Holliday junction resolvase RusA-like endonuclease